MSLISFTGLMSMKLWVLPLSIMPCLFPGKQIPGNHVPHFPMFGNHTES
jgi:hypothetical protein